MEHLTVYENVKANYLQGNERFNFPKASRRRFNWVKLI